MDKDLFWPWRGGTRKEKAQATGYLALLVLGWAALYLGAWWIGGGP